MQQGGVAPRGTRVWFDAESQCWAARVGGVVRTWASEALAAEWLALWDRRRALMRAGLATATTATALKLVDLAALDDRLLGRPNDLAPLVWALLLVATVQLALAWWDLWG